LSEELAIPGTGQLVDLEKEVECVQALAAVRQFESQIKEAKAILTAAIVDRSRVLGAKTFILPDGSKAEVRGGPEAAYDISEIEENLRALGMPEDRIREIVVEELSYKLSVREAKRAASANEDYASVIENAKRVEEKPYYISIRRP
jgi:hypothetical protein